MTNHCIHCGLGFDTLEGLLRHEYQLHGGKVWPYDKGWLERRRKEIRAFEIWKLGWRYDCDDE